MRRFPRFLLPSLLASLSAAMVLAPLPFDRAVRAGELECRQLESQVTEAGQGLVVRQLNAFLFQAAERGCVVLGESLIAAGADVKARRREGETALHHAAAAGEVDFVAMLIAQGADIEQRNLKGATPLFLAVEANRRKVAALLLEKGARVGNPGRSGVSPLAAAAFNGEDDIVDLLLERGADPDQEDASGKTAIVYAAARGFAGIVGRLLEAGVDVNRVYGNELTALMWAAGHANDVTEAEGLETVDLLIAGGARLDDLDNRGRTALMIAAELGHDAIVARLMEKGADAELKDKAGKSAIDLAANGAVKAALGKP